MSSWRTMRHLVAPREARTAISLERVIARASSRLATLAHAISRTRATAPMNVSRIARAWRPPMLSRISRRLGRVTGTLPAAVGTAASAILAISA